MRNKYAIKPVSRLCTLLTTLVTKLPARLRPRQVSAGVLSLCLLSTTAVAQNSAIDFEGEARDAWITGQAVTMLALSEHASAFDIDVHVESGRVTLTGVVDSDVNKELAGELVRAVDGVSSLNNALDVDANSERSFSEGDRDLKRWFDQTTINAEIKSRLLASSVTDGLDIEVETRALEIVLRGTVENAAERDLAGLIAENSSYGRAVRNNLVITGN